METKENEVLKGAGQRILDNMMSPFLKRAIYDAVCDDFDGYFQPLFVKPERTGTSGEPNQRSIDSILNKSHEIGAAGYIDNYEKMKVMDFQALTKSIVYNNNKDVFDKFYNFHKIACNKKIYNGFVRALTNLRGKYSHANEHEKLTSKVFLDDIKAIKRVITPIYQNNSKQYEEIYAMIDETASDALKFIGYPPIPISIISEKLDIPHEEIVSQLKANRFNYDKTNIYGASEDDIFKALTQKDVAVPVIVNEPVVPVILPELRKYTKDFLTGAQTGELYLNYNITVDTSVIISSSCRKTLEQYIIPSLIKQGHKLLVDRSVRSELFELAEIYEYPNEDQTAGELAEQQAELKKVKTAILFLNDLRSRGHLAYCGSGRSSLRPQETLPKLISDFPDKRICVLTQNPHLASRIDELNMKNSLAIKIIDDHLLIYKNFVKNLGADGQAPNTQTADVKVPESSKLIFSVGEKVYLADKTVVELRSKVAEGGEGVIYNIPDVNQVAKVYYPERRSAVRKEKLVKMISSNPQINQVCWPTQLIFSKGGDFIGYIMPKAPSNSMELGEGPLRINSSAVREKYFPNWRRKELASLAISICDVIAKLHNKNILLGDINPRNIIVYPNNCSMVYFVDCDSYQFDKYPCPVGTQIFTSPKIYERTGTDTPNFSSFLRENSDEEYAVASLLFQIIMVGYLPFASKGSNKEQLHAIKNFQFAYKTDANTGYDTPDGPGKMMWNHINKDLKNLFSNTFTGEGTYPVFEWKQNFMRYRSLLEMENFSNDLFPKMYYTPKGKENEFVDFVCGECGERANMTVDKYNRLNAERRALLCNQCLSIRQRAGKKLIEKVCPSCGKKHRISILKNNENEQRGKKPFCDECLGKGKQYYG